LLNFLQLLKVKVKSDTRVPTPWEQKGCVHVYILAEMRSLSLSHVFVKMMGVVVGANPSHSIVIDAYMGNPLILMGVGENVYVVFSLSGRIVWHD